jgi:hypothetical protein
MLASYRSRFQSFGNRAESSLSELYLYGAAGNGSSGVAAHFLTYYGMS